VEEELILFRWSNWWFWWIRWWCNGENGYQLNQVEQEIHLQLVHHKEIQVEQGAAGYGSGGGGAGAAGTAANGTKCRVRWSMEVIGQIQHLDQQHQVMEHQDQFLIQDILQEVEVGSNFTPGGTCKQVELVVEEHGIILELLVQQLNTGTGGGGGGFAQNIRRRW
jgi:hypothetical protein